MADFYKISVDGCDGSTVVKMELTETELQVVSKFIDKVNETARSGCEPTMEIEAIESL